MPTHNQKLSNALILLKELQDRGIVAIHAEQFRNTKHRQILKKYGFIREVSKGWYIASDPTEKEGESTAWYSAYWRFVGEFLTHKYEDNWCISAEQSLVLHAGNTSVPQQLIIRSPKANNQPTPLPFGTSVFNLKAKTPSNIRVNSETHLRLYTIQEALVNCSPSIYSKHAIDVRAILYSIRDASELLQHLIENERTSIAGRLAGAFRNIGKDKIANEIIETFKQADYDIREYDPFMNSLPTLIPIHDRSPYASRIRLMWAEMRASVIEVFPAKPQFVPDTKEYLKTIDEMYLTDAYHSLSIERYKVTPELISKVSSGDWNLIENEEDRRHRDAMAARGYYQAFMRVKESIQKIISGENSGVIIDSDLNKWYRALFDPSVVAGILKAYDLAGFRNQQVYIGNSKHVPLNVEAMRDAMPVLFELLKEEQEASVRAVLGHFIFVYIHPYMDGNGRIARFLMNAMLASGGYPWTIIPVQLRNEYMQALEYASVEQNIKPFAQFIGNLVDNNMKGNTLAQLPQ